jgi:c-di-GMP phosphodiesterase
MFSYVARQAILDKNKNLFAYELLFRDGLSNCFPDIAPDEATSKILTESHLAFGLEDITSNKVAFINFHEDTLLHRFPTSLPNDKVVIEIVETVPISEALVKACKDIKDMGYTIALDDHNFDPKWDVFLPYIDIIKIDIEDCDYETIARNIPKFKAANLKIIAERIETSEDFALYRDLGFDYFQGYFFARPEVLQKKKLPSSKMALVELMGCTSSANFDFERINQIIERDVVLPYMLLRFINHPLVNKRNKISSLRHALNYMGEIEVKKFVSLLALANLSDGKPMELIHLSLVRAKFCELLSIARHESQNPPMGFLAGLFSMLDALLDQSMMDVVEKLPLNEDLKGALCGKQSVLKEYLSLARAYEDANWKNINQYAKDLNIHPDTLHSFYNEAMKWGAAMKSMASKG